jgi:hypothetical protein
MKLDISILEYFIYGFLFVVGITFIMLDYALRNIDETKELYFPEISLITSVLGFPVVFPLLVLFYIVLLIYILSTGGVDSAWAAINKELAKLEND